MLSTEESAELMYRMFHIIKMYKENHTDESNRLYRIFMHDLDNKVPGMARYEVVDYIYSLDVTTT